MSAKANEPLERSVEKLDGAINRLADRLEHLESGGLTESDRMMRHLRRYMPFYALASIWVLMIVLLPTRPGGDGAAQTLGQVTPGDGIVVGGTSGGDDAAGSSFAGSGGTGSRASTEGAVAFVIPDEIKGLDPLAWDKTGKTKGGFDCKPGVRQIPWSAYAPPCFPAWSGNNAGSTHRGVSATEIIIVDRQFPDSASSQAVDAFVQAAGFASADEFRETREVFKKYFQNIYELWGRKLVFKTYESQNGDSTAEAQSQGKDGACADADEILEQFKPFAVIGDTTHPFGECGAERGLVILGTGAYYPEKWYDTYHPYLWNGVMECERIAYLNAEYIGKRLAHKPAKWAKGLRKGLDRVLGLYVPNNDNYQHCVNIASDVLEKKYNFEIESRYNYALDVSRFPDEAARAVVQFNADGVTTIFLACDPLSPIFLTQAAAGQEFNPEWVTNGAGLTDVEQFARLWDQEQIQWSLFGMSSLGDTSRILGPQGEGTITYKRATGNDIPPGTQTEYYALSGVYGLFQAMGPIVTPNNVAKAYWNSPPGGAPHYEVGYTSYRDGPDGTPGATDHTAVDDMREIYWLCTSYSSGDAEGSSRCTEPKSYDGNGGTYVPTYDGRRFRPGQWPKGDPPVFPEYVPPVI